MKTKTKLITVISLLLSIVSFAQTPFTDGDFNYEVISTAPPLARITGENLPNNIPLDLVIPETASDGTTEFTISEVGNDAFNGTNLASIGIPNTIVEIENGAFINNPLTDVTIPDSVNRIGLNAFLNCRLTSITLGTGLENIDNGAFLNNQLTSITIPASVTAIGDGAFNGNPTITTIEVLATTPPTTFANSFGNRNTINVTVPAEALDTYLDDPNWDVFFSINDQYAGVTPFTFTRDNISYLFIEAGVPNKVRLTGNTNTGVITIPEEIIINTIKFQPTVIGNDAFKGNNVASITIPNTIVKIDNGAFIDNPLTTVVIPDNVTEIGLDAFKDCINLNTLDLGTGLSIINNGAFLNNDLTDITIPANVTTIGDGSFIGNDLETITVLAPQPPTTFSNSFGIDRGAINVTVPDNEFDAYLTDGDWQNFFSINGQYTGVTPFTFTRDNISYLLIEAGVPNKVRLTGNTNTGDITIPAEIIVNNTVLFQPTVIGNDAFQGNNVASITIPNTIIEIDNGAFINNPMTEVIIPDSVTRIGTDAFLNSRLTSITLGAGLEIIDNGAFLNNNLTSITIPANVTAIGDGAFNGNNLETITSLATSSPDIVANSFGFRGSIDLFVPQGTIAIYLANDWTGFNSINGEINIDITLALKVFLQGATINPNAGEEDLMRDDLRIAGLLPTTSPYADARRLGDTIRRGVVFDEGKIVDLVFVELIDRVDQTTVFDSRSLVVFRNGEIKDYFNGFVLPATFENLFFDPVFNAPEEEDYFIRIQHRNHVAIQTATPISSQIQTVNLDFTTDPTLVEGGQNALVEVSEGVFAMIAGDFDENEQVQPSDVNETTALIGTSSYSNADMDMNGQIQPADVNNLVNPNVGRGVQFVTAE